MEYFLAVLLQIFLIALNAVFACAEIAVISMNETKLNILLAKGLTGILSVVSVLFKPVVWLLSVSTNGILKLFGISSEDKGDEVIEEDIIMMAQVGKESGNIQCDESQFIKNVFQFTDLTIGEICTHRKDIDVLYADESAEEWKEKISSTFHTYYPVCGETPDDIQGVLSTKAYFRLQDHAKEHVLRNAVQSPLFLFENVPANKAFEKMKNAHEYFCVVLDEYGGVTGIVTIHDLLEVLVGDMHDKDEEEDYTVRKLEDGVWEITGIAPFYKVEEALGITVRDTEVEYETFNGYIYSLLQTPVEESGVYEVNTEQFNVRVMETERQCITKFQLRIR